MTDLSIIKSELNRLNENITDLFDKRDDMVKDINTNETDIKVHIKEDESVHKQHKEIIDDIKVRIKLLEKFQSMEEGKEKGKGWVQKYIPWLTSLALFLLLIVDRIVKYFGGLLENSHP